jgi:hypothetical protein
MSETWWALGALAVIAIITLARRDAYVVGFEAGRKHGMRWVPKCVYLRNDPRALIRELLDDVMRSHADPHDADFNDCGGPDDDTFDCQWCEEAREIIRAIDVGDLTLSSARRSEVGRQESHEDIEGVDHQTQAPQQQAGD